MLLGGAGSWVMEGQQVGTPDLPPHQLPDPSLEGGFSEFYRECSVPWGRGVLPEALGQALRGGGCGHTGRVSGSRSMKLGVLRLQRGEGVLLRESRGMDQAGPSVCPVTRAERSRRACRVGLRAQLCPVLPDLALLQARSGVGGTGVESAWRGPARVTSKQEVRGPWPQTQERVLPPRMSPGASDYPSGSQFPHL